MHRNEQRRNERGPLEDRDRDYGARPRGRDLREPIRQSLVQYQPRTGRPHPNREYRPFLGEAVALVPVLRQKKLWHAQFCLGSCSFAYLATFCSVETCTASSLVSSASVSHRMGRLRRSCVRLCVFPGCLVLGRLSFLCRDEGRRQTAVLVRRIQLVSYSHRSTLRRKAK